METEACKRFCWEAYADPTSPGSLSFGWGRNAHSRCLYPGSSSTEGNVCIFLRRLYFLTKRICSPEMRAPWSESVKSAPLWKAGIIKAQVHCYRWTAAAPGLWLELRGYDNMCPNNGMISRCGESHTVCVPCCMWTAWSAEQRSRLVSTSICSDLTSCSRNIWREPYVCVCVCYQSHTEHCENTHRTLCVCVCVREGAACPPKLSCAVWSLLWQLNCRGIMVHLFNF